MGTKGEIQKLLSEKRQLEQKVTQLQKDCKHPVKVVKFVPVTPEGHQSHARYVCEECEKVIGIPSPSAIEKFLQK